MTDYAEADRRLISWLAERTDIQLQRLLDAPEKGLTNATWVVSETCKCLAGWTFGWSGADVERMLPVTAEDEKGATAVLSQYAPLPYRERMRRIQGFAAAELLTRRVERPKLMPGREVMTADPLNSGYSEEVGT